jgi:hypothetical protein
MSKVSAYNLLKYLIVESTIMYSTNLPRYRPITFTSSSSSRQARQRLSCLFARIFNQKAWRRLRVCSAVCSSLCPPPRPRRLKIIFNLGRFLLKSLPKWLVIFQIFAVTVRVAPHRAEQKR